MNMVHSIPLTTVTTRFYMDQELHNMVEAEHEQVTRGFPHDLHHKRSLQLSPHRKRIKIKIKADRVIKYCTTLLLRSIGLGGGVY